MKVIAATEDPAVIKRILAHLKNGQGTGRNRWMSAIAR